MKATGIGKRILIFTLIAVIVLTMQGPRVFAGSLQPENRSETSAEQAANQPETAEGQPENQLEMTEGQSGIQNDLPEEEQKIQPEITEEESVSGNDLSVLQSVNPPAVAAKQTDANAYLELTDDILNKCIVPGMNPPGVTVNLFDYWQDENNERGEIAHDQVRGVLWHTYNIGISRGHLLRFGYKCVGCGDCDVAGDFGTWNDSITGGPCQGIVQNKLGAYGYPVLNFKMITDKSKFGGYANLDANEQNEYLSDEKKEESLAYLFSPSVRLPDYKAIYGDVQGLFQPDGDGYYYYNSTENFASYNDRTNSFILYNSPGVAEESSNKDSRGQFFPFNRADDVFDTYTAVGDKYHLCYIDREGKSIGVPNSYYKPISIDGNSYLYCSADRLNHFLGMTMEFSFQQPKNGCMSEDGKEMTFEFTGDDDVWIFIDNVLVADLGGLHDACSLKIDFATGEVNVEGEQKAHTLLDSFKAAYGEHSDLGGISFRGDTFADDTIHTLKMFYLERGHGASDLALKFNVLTIPDEPVKEETPNVPNKDNGEIDGSIETEESAPDPAAENTSASTESNISRSDDHMTLNTTGIPQTGDDSRIGWLIALCIISLSGIVVAVYNLIFIGRKKKNHSSKE